jgi:glycerophosphoryl diester phosphodiesterase
MFAARVIGHRGCAAHAPENTLAGLRAAAARGVTWVEIDVCVLGDGTPVIIHDATVDRTTNGRGTLAELDWPRVERLDAGAWFGPQFAGERVPRLDQALHEIARLGLGLNLELKVHGGDGGRLVDAVTPVLRAAKLPHAQLLMSSFDHGALAAFHAAMPETAIGVLHGEIRPGWRTTAQALDAVAVIADWRKLTERAAREVAADGRDLHVYTPNLPSQVYALWRWGLDGVITDDPDAFRGT